MDIVEYERRDFIDDSVKIVFEVPTDLKDLIEKYIQCINKKDYQSALDYNFHIETCIKNNYAAGKITQRERNILCRKYHI